MRFLTFLIIAFALISTPTSASLNTGMDFFSQCSLENENTIELINCIGYIAGYLDGYRSAEAGIRLCIPEKGLSPEQAILIFNKFARDNPEKLQMTARILFGVSLAKAFPCEESVE